MEEQITKIDEHTLIREKPHKELLNKEFLEQEKKNYEDRIVEIDNLLAKFEEK